MSTETGRRLTVVIFGAHGMLGQALQAEFADAYDVRGYSRTDVDITDSQSVRKAITGADWVINAAAYTKVDDCETQFEQALRINGTAAGIVAAACAADRIPFVHYSTDYVFSGTKANGYLESDTMTDPVNAYGRSKLAGEQVIQQAGGQYYILRTAWLYGHGGPNFVDTITKLASTKPELKVVNDQHGSPTYTVDLAHQTRVIVEGGYAPGIYHATNSGDATWFEFAKAIVSLQQLPCTVVPCTSAEFPRPAKRPSYSILLNTKLPPLPSWQNALQRYLTRAE